MEKKYLVIYSLLNSLDMKLNQNRFRIFINLNYDYRNYFYIIIVEISFILKFFVDVINFMRFRN
jgi:hypothetical protein